MSTGDLPVVDPSDPHRGQQLLSAGVPLGSGRGVVVLLHGRNAGPGNILELAAQLDLPDVTWLAPAAAGRAWYPLSFLAPRSQNEPGLSSALGVVASLVSDAATTGVPAARIVVAGSSQGACLATEFVYRHPGLAGGLIAFSGGLIGPPDTTWAEAVALPGVPAFFGCSDVDAHVPWTRVADSAAVFERAGAAVDLRQYPGMGHLVNADEIAGARALLDTAFGRR